MFDDSKPSHDHDDAIHPQDQTRDSDPDATLGSDPGSSAPGESPGTLIGRYRLIHPLGEGGFGTVFLAEQLEPVSREVALKIIKLGMDTKQVIARFEAERQALAMMNHPGIAKVFDAGTTDAGRPYFVMELVRGVPITEYCDRKRLKTRERLALFNQVCEAVQHAHQKGIIHRDIKPSNVLVGEADGRPVPKVIDFGIAKATNQRLTEKTIFTQQAQIIGTPAYMSPEQAEVSEMDIDTRSDIYSLGVLLYELLSGVTPFDSTKLLSAGYGEIQRIIREVDPPAPSTRVSGLGDLLETTADHRQLHGSQLVKRLKGELDWVVMKCLEKDRARRYETANGLARDVERYLNDEPVAASPPSRSYRLKKLIVRNRAVFAAGSIMVLLLGAGVVGTSVGLVRAKRAERDAVIAASKSDQVATFLTDMLSGVGPSAARGRDTEMLEEILQETDEKLGAELVDQPEVEGEIRSYLGVTYFDLGQYEKAKEQYEMARELLIAAHGEVHADVAMQDSNLGLVCEALQQYEAAEEYQRRALAMRIDLFGERDAAVGESKTNLANLLVNISRYEEAEPLLLDALTIQRETLGEEHEFVATTLNSLGNLMQHLRRYEEAGPYYDEALAMHEKTLGLDHPFVITDRVNLGWLHYNLGDFAAAAVYFADAEVAGRRIYGEAHPRLAEILTAGGRCAVKLGRNEEAETKYREALAMAAEVYGPDHISTSEFMADLAKQLVDEGKQEEGDELVERVVAIQTEQLGALHPTTIKTLYTLAYDVYSRGDYDEAVRRLRASREDYTAVYGLEHKDTALVINSLGRALQGRGDLKEAEAAYGEALDIRTRLLGEDDLMVFVTKHDLAATRRAQLRFDEAAELLDEVVVGYIAALDSTHRGVGMALTDLAFVKLDLDRPAEALDAALRAREILAAAQGVGSKQAVFSDVAAICAMGCSGDMAGADSLLDETMPKLGELSPDQRARAEVELGRHLTSAGRYGEAEQMLLSAHDVLADLHGEKHFESRKAVRAIVDLYERWAAAGSATANEKAARWR